MVRWRSSALRNTEIMRCGIPFVHVQPVPYLQNKFCSLMTSMICCHWCNNTWEEWIQGCELNQPNLNNCTCESWALCGIMCGLLLALLAILQLLSVGDFVWYWKGRQSSSEPVCDQRSQKKNQVQLRSGWVTYMPTQQLQQLLLLSLIWCATPRNNIATRAISKLTVKITWRSLIDLIIIVIIKSMGSLYRRFDIIGSHDCGQLNEWCFFS